MCPDHHRVYPCLCCHFLSWVLSVSVSLPLSVCLSLSDVYICPSLFVFALSLPVLLSSSVRSHADTSEAIARPGGTWLSILSPLSASRSRLPAVPLPGSSCFPQPSPDKLLRHGDGPPFHSLVWGLTPCLLLASLGRSLPTLHS